MVPAESTPSVGAAVPETTAGTGTALGSMQEEEEHSDHAILRVIRKGLPLSRTLARAPQSCPESGCQVKRLDTQGIRLRVGSSGASIEELVPRAQSCARGCRLYCAV